MKYNRLISHGALIALIGYIMSGPVTFVIVNLIHPQPLWISPKVFAENYSILQDLPFYFGFLLIGGMLMVVTGHYFNCKAENEFIKFLLLIAFACTVVFCTLISFNYICQTTYVHNLALNYKSEFDSSISTFSMSNPLSFCWANEMWGYAILGIATWLMSAYYIDKSNLIRYLLIANGVVSLISVAWTIIDVSWVMTTLGLILYFIWNILMIIIMILVYRYSKNLSDV